MLYPYGFKTLQGLLIAPGTKLSSLMTCRVLGGLAVASLSALMSQSSCPSSPRVSLTPFPRPAQLTPCFRASPRLLPLFPLFRVIPSIIEC